MEYDVACLHGVQEMDVILALGTRQLKNQTKT